MRTVLMFLFAALMIYVVWWLIGSLRRRIAFEVEMALGVGSFWAAYFVAILFEPSQLAPWPTALSLAGYAILILALGLVTAAMFSLRRGGKPTDGWERTTELTRSGIHGLVRHPMQLSGIVGACGTSIAWPSAAVLPLSVLSVICFALAARAEDQFNLNKFSEAYRLYMQQVPALNLLAGIRTCMRLHKKP
jgi:protein-S-isoprenylcysteine O-methyltransferase Ste14